VRIPVWLTLAIAALVIIFGAYRIYIAARPASDDANAKPRSRLYAMSKRTHLFVGIIYLALGAGLIATSFGWSPFGSSTEIETRPVEHVPVSPSAPADPPPTK
jgi:hypothetical protein